MYQVFPVKLCQVYKMISRSKFDTKIRIKNKKILYMLSICKNKKKYNNL